MLGMSDIGETKQPPSDSMHARPYKQTFDGKELPWDETGLRYCGHFSQRFAGLVGISRENTIPGFIEILGIDAARKDGRLAKLTAADMVEFFEALAENKNYYIGGLPPRFWSEFSTDEKQAAIVELEGLVPPGADPILPEAVHILAQELVEPINEA